MARTRVCKVSTDKMNMGVALYYRTDKTRFETIIVSK
jgi:hypothetical protein